MSKQSVGESVLLYGTHPVEAVLRHVPEVVDTVYVSDRMAPQVRKRWVALAAEQSVAVSEVDADWFAQKLPGLQHQKIAADYRQSKPCLLYTSPSPRDQRGSRMPSSA